MEFDPFWNQITENDVRVYVCWEYAAMKSGRFGVHDDDSHEIDLSDEMRETGLSQEKLILMCDQGDMMYSSYQDLIDSIYPNYPDDHWTQ